MGLRDWIARRSGGGTEGGEDVGAGGVERRRPPVAGDGGWREVAPLVPTLGGAARGVSDGLDFRSRLASWQDPSLCGPLGHAVLPTAPVGILRVVAVPGSPSTVEGGDELVLPDVWGAVGAEEPAEPPEPPEPGDARSVQRSVQRRAAVRRLPVRAVQRVARAGAPEGRAVPEGADGGGPSTSGLVPGASRSARSTVGTPEPDAGAARESRSDDVRSVHGSVRPRPVGEPLTVARRPRSLTARPVAVVPGSGRTPETGGEPSSLGMGASRPVAAAELPAAGSAEVPARRAPVPEEQAERPVQRAAVTNEGGPARPVLGEPMAALPASAAPPTATGSLVSKTASGAPAMPVVPADAAGTGPATSAPADAPDRGSPVPSRPQRGSARDVPVQRTPSGAPSGRTRPGPVHARTRGGLGAPLDALPPTAAAPGGAAPLVGGRRPVGRDGGTAAEQGAPTAAAAPGGAAPLLGGRRPVRRVVGPDAGRDGERAVGRGAPAPTASASDEGLPVQRAVNDTTGPADLPVAPVGERPAGLDGRVADGRQARSANATGGSTVRPLNAPASRPGDLDPVPLGHAGGPAPSVTVPVRPVGGGPAVRRAAELVGSRRGLLGARRMTVALAGPSATTGSSAPAGAAAAPAPPVVPAAWPHALGSRAQVQAVSGNGRTAGDRPSAQGGSVGRGDAPTSGRASGGRPVVAAVRRSRSRGSSQDREERVAVDRPLPWESPTPSGTPGETAGSGVRSGADGAGVRSGADGWTTAEGVADPGRSSGGRGVVAAIQRLRSRGSSRQSATDRRLSRRSSDVPGGGPVVQRSPSARSPERGDDQPAPQGSPLPPAAAPIAGAPATLPLNAVTIPRGFAPAPTPAPRPTPTGSGPSSAVVTAQRLPLVRPAPVVAPALQRLPAVARIPQPSPAQPPAAPPPPVAQRTLSAAPPSPVTARMLQRVAEQAGPAGVPLTGVPLTAVPARKPTTVQAVPPQQAAPPSQGASPPTETTAPGPADLDDLARRLVEPVGRLLRTELRRGRERAGRPYDMRR